MLHRSPVLWLALLLFLAGLAGCGPREAPVAELPPLPVMVSQPIERKDAVDYDEYEGRIAAVKTVEVRSRVQGHILRVAFQDGQLVKKGDLLFEIDPRRYQATLDAAKAMKASGEATLQLAKAEFARVSSLVAKNAASREELDVLTAKQATSRADVLKAEADIERAQVDVEHCNIVAPISGRISRPLVTEGNLVNGGGGEQLLTTIVSTGPMYVYFPVDERSLQEYRRTYAKGADTRGEHALKELKIPVFVALEGENSFRQEGFLDFMENQFNAGTGTIQVRGDLPKPSQLMTAGMRARVRIPVSDPHKALLIDERAVGSDQGLKFVYIVTDKDIVERRDVQLGRHYDGRIDVKSGLAATDWIVVSRIQRVREGMKVKPQQVPMPSLMAAP